MECRWCFVVSQKMILITKNRVASDSKCNITAMITLQIRYLHVSAIEPRIFFHWYPIFLYNASCASEQICKSYLEMRFIERVFRWYSDVLLWHYVLISFFSHDLCRIHILSIQILPFQLMFVYIRMHATWSCFVIKLPTKFDMYLMSGSAKQQPDQVWCLGLLIFTLDHPDSSML